MEKFQFWNNNVPLFNLFTEDELEKVKKLGLKNELFFDATIEDVKLISCAITLPSKKDFNLMPKPVFVQVASYLNEKRNEDKFKDLVTGQSHFLRLYDMFEGEDVLDEIRKSMLFRNVHYDQITLGELKELSNFLGVISKLKSSKKDDYHFINVMKYLNGKRYSL